MECQIIWKRRAASGVPIPDIFILGVPHNPVHYRTQIFQGIAIECESCCMGFMETKNMFYFCNGTYIGGKVGGGWYGIV